MAVISGGQWVSWYTPGVYAGTFGDSPLKNGNNGILVEPSEEGIRNGLQLAFNMSDIEKKAMTSNAQQTILERFNLKKQVVSELKALDISGVTSGKTGQNR